jgi:hypothetical protein
MDPAFLGDFYERRSPTREELELFTNNDTASVDDGRFGNLTDEQRCELLKVGLRVCSIEFLQDDGFIVQKGSGWYLGGGWVISNQHVICGNDEQNSDADTLQFRFPGMQGKSQLPPPHAFAFSPTLRQMRISHSY